MNENDQILHKKDEEIVYLTQQMFEKEKELNTLTEKVDTLERKVA